MSVKLHYFNGRGLGEQVRVALCAANIEFTEVFYTERQQFLDIINDGRLLFNQLPLLEIDGVDLNQSRACVRYVAERAGLMGKDVKQNARINVLIDGALDVRQDFLGFGFVDEATLCKKIKENQLSKYLPIFNKVLQDNGTGFAVGDKMTLADVVLYEVLLTISDYFGMDTFGEYPHLHKFVEKLNSTPEMKVYLSKYRKRKNDAQYVREVKCVLDRES